MYDPIPDRVIDAARELSACVPVLGRRTYTLIHRVVGQGLQIKDIAETHREKTTLADCLRHGLEDLAEHWSLKTRNN